MLWIKAFHIVFVTCWFAGLFYLPRIFVNLALLAPGAAAERARLLLMARKLLRFTTLLSAPALALGVWLWLGYGIGRGPGSGWMHAKLAVVLLVIGYHHGCGRLLRQPADGRCRRSPGGLDGRQGGGGAAGDRLPPWLRPAVAPTGRWPLPPQPGVAALVQRTAAAAADGGGAAGGAQAVLTPARMHQSSAGPLALSYAALIVFASLFPFEGWRAQGIDPLVFLLGALPPPYWTWFDVLTNAAGYAPLGFLLALGLLRTGSGRRAVLLATLAGALLSLAMEFLQIYLPRRVPSNLDLALNAAGALAGASIAALLERLGVLGRWHDWRERWLLPDARGALVLLALWPPALLFPAAVPFGLGQVQQRLETALIGWLAHTPSMPSMPLPDGLPLRQTALAPLSPGGELLCVALLLLALPRRACAAMLLLALVWQLALLNQAPTSAYFAQTLQLWEQGRFIRFYGLGQWLGWLWPYATLLYVLLRVSGRQRHEPLS